jgi:hypothetical protein
MTEGRGQKAEVREQILGLEINKLPSVIYTLTSVM